MKDNVNKKEMAKGNSEIILSKSVSASIINKDIQKDARKCISTKKIFKRFRESSLEASSSKQKSDNIEVYFKYNFIFTICF